MATAKSVLGHKAECLAAGLLRRMGYKRMERNYRCRYGEIDIIAWDGDCLAFVEVRSHTTSSFGSPADSIGPRKQTRIYRTAQTYLEAKQLEEPNCRFDVVEVVFTRGSVPSVELIKDAFPSPDVP